MYRTINTLLLPCPFVGKSVQSIEVVTLVLHLFVQALPVKHVNRSFEGRRMIKAFWLLYALNNICKPFDEKIWIL